ncbi:unnamed protein product [Haemonchus placei]|uniref:Ion_trans_2 domain-containing protein n=1 Tax=Haemonchus placei TaxID=6290 RepID=A0A158QP71_HAEPC|nr:unnamed protein product [Haemonchus placei]
MEVEEEEGTAIEEETPITWKKRVKMALPHAALYFSLFMYLMAGAALFYHLEYEADEKIQSEKLDRIKHSSMEPYMGGGEKAKEWVGAGNHRIARERRSLKSNQRKSSSLEETDEIESANGEEEEESEKAKPPAAKRLPLSINAGILLVFCMMGGVTYIAAGGKATFLEAFFVTFNLVANLTMSEMPSDLNHVLTLIYIFVFVTFGVAVLSMCAELAALELKDIFLKIHYFGRKIKFKRKSKKEQIEVEVKELLKIIEEIRRRYPDKERITSLDILRYMNEASAERAVLTERRDTIAFQPQTMEMLKFADEQDLEDRSASRLEEAPLIEKPPHK